MLGIKHEEEADLTGRLRQLAELHIAAVPAPRRPLDDPLPPPAPLVSWVMSDVARAGGRMYVLGTKGGPGFTSATWLQSGRPHVG